MVDTLELDIELAEEAQRFLSSRLGKRVAALAGEEIDRCTQELKTVSPHDVSRIQSLQETIRRNETLGAWMLEILHRGHQAKQQTAEEQ